MLLTIKRIIPLFLIVFLLHSCNNDLELLGPREEKPVVYGALNKADTIIYIRLEKIFADENIAPVTLAQDPSNLYYDNAKVILSTEGWSGELNRVDATSIGFPRQSGAFANAPNYIYYLPTSDVLMNPGKEYNLKIEANNKIFTAKTVLIDGIILYAPDPTKPYTIIPKVSGKLPTLDFDPVSKDPNAAPRIISVFLTLNYSEKSNETGGKYETKEIEVALVRDAPITGLSLDYDPQVFYAALQDRMNSGADITRIANNMKLKFITGGKEYVQYNQSVGANSGITSTADFPVYSNIEGGIGIFTSKNVQIFNNIGLSKPTLDSIALSRFTKNLGFK